MMYAIQGNSVRMFLSPEENYHLFANFDPGNNQTELMVQGNWYQGLIFKPIANNYKRHALSFPIIRIPQGEAIISSVLIPVDVLKLSRNTKTIKNKAYIYCHPEPDATIKAYPVQIIEDPVDNNNAFAVDIASSDYDVDRIKQLLNPERLEAISERNSLQNTQTPQINLDKPKEIMQEDPEPEILQPIAQHLDIAPQFDEHPINHTDKSDDILNWPKIHIDYINTWLKKYPEISVLVENNGKLVKFSRRVKVRRDI